MNKHLRGKTTNKMSIAQHGFSEKQQSEAQATARQWLWLLRVVFPHWSRYDDWTLVFAQLCGGYYAHVDVHAQTIFVPCPLRDDLMIHVMCHAVTRSKQHDERWAAGMQKAAHRLLLNDYGCLCIDSKAD